MSNILRRTTLGLGVAGLVTPAASLAAVADPALFPQYGDVLVFDTEKRAGTIIAPAAIKPDAPPVRAWSMEPNSRIIRNRSRFAQILLVRLKSSNVTETDMPLAADGVVAFSATCTHAGCLVSGWKAAEGYFLCPCHGSVYDPVGRGHVVAGPASRPLPMLPLCIHGGELVVSGTFTDRIGGDTGRTD